MAGLAEVNVVAFTDMGFERAKVVRHPHNRSTVVDADRIDIGVEKAELCEYLTVFTESS